MFVLMTYDVNAKRTGIFRKLLRKYLGHEQNSVFSGALKMSELTKLRKEINKSLVEGDKLTELIVPNRHTVEIAESSTGNRVYGLPSRTSAEKQNRTSFVQGKRVTVRVNLHGHSTIPKKQ